MGPPAPQKQPGFDIPGLVFFFALFKGMAAATLARPATCSTGLTAVFNALFFITFPYNGAATDWT